ncbi:hypothetical protein [Novosphingobium sp. PhB165]|uniref:hypothetical protein n=1 Tax=Novosphingobium sp. PhB165 TaxID=2485105 RepID=UPI0014051C2F|nr:hypothetical protein [Novosphingobium sp. PhB165]
MQMKARFALIWLVACTGCGGELADKPAWADLQKVEFSDRSNSSNGTAVQRLPDGFEVLAVHGRGALIGGPVSGIQQPRRSWIMLNEHATDKRVKQIAQFAAYDLRCAEVDGLEKRVTDIDSYVIRYLRSICAQ